MNTSYAGFWKRFVAYLIDGFLIGAVAVLLIVPVLGIFGLGASAVDTFDDDAVTAGFIIAAIAAYGLIMLVVFIGSWLYYAFMESSEKQATLGKMALGIAVTDLNGNRISFARATGRYFGKIISSLVLNLGYVIAGFTQQKQALHDILAGTLVINKR